MAPIVTRREEARALKLARSQPESAPELNAYLAEIGGRITHFAKADPRVRERLDGVRSRVLAVDYREDKPDEGDRPLRYGEVGFYDYDHDVLVVAVVDPFAEELVELEERRVSPPITLEELAEALDLLKRRKSKLQAALARRRARIAAFPAPSYAFVEGSGREGHRGCIVYVESEGRVLHGVVDLSARQVVADKDLDETLRGGRRGRPVA
jgi:hypothetical protein